MNYESFLEQKTHLGSMGGFNPIEIPDYLFPFQRLLVDWSIRKGRSAIFADCGLGKSPMELVWADNVVRHTNGRVLILTPLAVGHQIVREGEKFGIECKRSFNGILESKITVANYQRLHYFNPSDFDGVVCDEASILKNFDGVTKAAVTDFMRKVKYRLLATATAAPNDYIELGTLSEAIGELGFMDMISRFFKKSEKCSSRSDEFRDGMWRFRGHAQRDFWRWVCSWSRAIRKPSDFGFDDGPFQLPPLTTVEHVISARQLRPGYLVNMPAFTLEEQREERRRTIVERCEKVAELVSGTGHHSVSWCHLNDEGDLLEKLIKDSKQVSGADEDEQKEEIFEAFESGQLRALITKPTIGGFGLNWQHCSHQTFFPSHSFEQWYQSIRRCWRFGQKNPVRVDVVSSEGEAGVAANMKRKSEACDRMFNQLVELMNSELRIEKKNTNIKQTEAPIWLSNKN